MEYNKGLYVHIPFCDHICAYCDFARQIYHEETVNNYLDALSVELEVQNIKDVTTVYIGGGTPSSLKLGQLQRLFEHLQPYTESVVEYTIEVNPESLTEAKAKLFKEYGINRVSMGLQVTQDHLLKIVERQHDINTVKAAITLLKQQGIHNISVDLMYGIPTQTLKDWKESLYEVVALDVTHLSLYALTIEPHSKFGRKGYQEIDADLDADMYEMAQTILKDHGFDQYEVSNFAKANYQSLHNRVYWHYQDYYGVGLNAAGKIGTRRYNNTRSMNDYLRHDFVAEDNNLSAADVEFEYIMMNLRLIEGLNLHDFKYRLKKTFTEVYASEIKALEHEGLANLTNTHLQPTHQGMMLLHNVIEKFLRED